VLEKGSPATFAAFNMQKLKPDMYALNWLLSLFSDQHPLSRLLIVWDLIFMHLDQKDLFVSGLCVAHLNQCQIGLNEAETLQRILGTVDFDIQRLSEDTNRIVGITKIVTMGDVRSKRPPVTVLMVILGVLAFVFLFLYWQLR
jgi:hypothetical protein